MSETDLVQNVKDSEKKNYKRFLRLLKASLNIRVSLDNGQILKESFERGIAFEILFQWFKYYEDKDLLMKKLAPFLATNLAAAKVQTNDDLFLHQNPCCAKAKKTSRCGPYSYN